MRSPLPDLTFVVGGILDLKCFEMKIGNYVGKIPNTRSRLPKKYFEIWAETTPNEEKGVKI